VSGEIPILPSDVEPDWLGHINTTASQGDQTTWLRKRESWLQRLRSWLWCVSVWGYVLLVYTGILFWICLLLVKMC